MVQSRRAEWRSEDSARLRSNIDLQGLLAIHERTNEELKLPPRYVLTFEPSDIVEEKVEKRYKNEQPTNEQLKINEEQQDKKDKEEFPFRMAE